MQTTPTYNISTDSAHLNLDAIHAFLTTSYWASGIPKHVVEKSIKNSTCVGAYLQDKQVGFARIITDKATFAYLADVYVEVEHRGHGLAKRMVQALFDLPDSKELRRWMLFTRDAHAVYAPFGFKPANRPENIMEIGRETPYDTL